MQINGGQKRLIALLLCLASLLTGPGAARADEEDLVIVHLDERHSLWDVTFLQNGEIWLGGRRRDTTEQVLWWLAQINDKGEVLDYYVWDHYVSPGRLVQIGDRYCITRSYPDEHSVMQYAFIPLLGNGRVGTEVAIRHATHQVLRLSSGLMCVSIFTAEPWFTIYDEDLNLILEAEQPFDILPGLSAAKEPHALRTALIGEEADDLDLWVSFDERNYRMKVNRDGTVIECVDLNLEPFLSDVCAHEGRLYVTYKEMVDQMLGADWLVCMTGEGERLWERKLTSDDGYTSIQKSTVTEHGLLMHGEVSYPGHVDPLTIAVAFDGTIVSEVQIPYIMDIFVHRGIYEGSLYIIGMGQGERKERIVMKKLLIDELWQGASQAMD